MSEITFRTKAVLKVLQSLDINKATGPDMIPAVVVKKCAPELAPPAPKKGSKADPSNYRPIALLSAISKVMGKCVNQELINTLSFINYVTHVWNKLIHSFDEAHVVALDISKAFDQLWHASLRNRLLPYGLPVKLCDWLADFLSGRKITVMALPESHSFKLLGVSFIENMIWHGHVSSIATAAGKKIRYLFRARKYFSLSNLLALHKAQIRPSLEYCSHIWGAAAPTTLSILDAVQRRAI
nr:unnamed protein product [Callosobruchus chinensis]